MELPPAGRRETDSALQAPPFLTTDLAKDGVEIRLGGAGLERIDDDATLLTGPGGGRGSAGDGHEQGEREDAH